MAKAQKPKRTSYHIGYSNGSSSRQAEIDVLQVKSRTAFQAGEKENEAMWRKKSIDQRAQFLYEKLVAVRLIGHKETDNELCKTLLAMIDELNEDGMYYVLGHCLGAIVPETPF